MHPRLIVIQPSHVQRNPELVSGNWALHHAIDNREMLGPMVRLCILATRMVARIIYPHDTASLATGRDPSQDRTMTYFDPSSDEYQRIRQASLERQSPGRGDPIYVEGPELLVHIHAPRTVGLATYFASSRTAHQALMQIAARRSNPTNVYSLSLEYMNSRSFAWHAPVWQPSTSVWRGANRHVDSISQFLSGDVPLAATNTPSAA